ncbi:NAD(P)/FAD-dependent oxidoreductase [Solimonas sp. K1W22B-7]|uniref:flavin-containing monooxygenase n=1 Tax=Solimonas sp. K1W22B-7 TaxID=2303331 RepID=UPI000E32F383|nr:NAD(P)/FAD-dependent oxidoreductase [Solimonas sp. K1W22B-7]AXQ27613.1 NAD(P)/FAD-dependent oxidoreductase [Solimonas sp. K1W22B-7]
MSKVLDVVIIGAGVSGIGMACRLRTEQPGKSFLVLERRKRVGGTWDLFRYPGVRSDSDMFTYGFQFKPWRDYRTLADGTSIRNYLGDAARDFGVAERIEYGIHCTAADWDSESQLWTISATHEPSGEKRSYQARFVVSAQGYYNYDQGYRPAFKGEEQFQGQIIHPQQWPENLDYSGKKVVVIGSGATAVTLVPAMAEKASQVTMLQRSPTYIFSLPGWDRMTQVLDKVLPEGWSYALARKRNLEIWQTTYKLCKRFPNAMRRFFVGQAKRHLGERFTMKDFNPQYGPWDQRLCAVPNANLFTTIRKGRADVVTDGIDRFTATGIRLASGKVLEADIIVTATGLSVQMFGGMALRVDGAPYNVAEKMAYKSVLLQDLPNFAWIFGYINLSWTMKADMSSLYLCRLFAHMDQHDQAVVIPRDRDNVRLDTSVLDQLNAGYVQRARHLLPRQGRTMPWIVRHHYQEDREMMLRTAIADPAHLEAQPPHSAAQPKVLRRAA